MSIRNSWYASKQRDMLHDFFDEEDYYRGCSYTYHVVIKRHPNLKHFCGYVGIPKKHPLYGMDFDHRILVPNRDNIRIGNQSYIALFIEGMNDDESRCSIQALLDVHGSVSWARDHVPLEAADGNWWFGFDLNHYNDLNPADIMKYTYDGCSDMLHNRKYRNMSYAKYMCTKLASQLCELEDYKE